VPVNFGNWREPVRYALSPLIALVLILVVRWTHKSAVPTLPHPPPPGAIPKTRWGRILSAIAQIWVLFIGGFAFYYGNLPIWGSTVPTAEQPIAVQIKGTIRYVTPEIASRSHLAEKLFFGTWWAMLGIFAVYHAKRVYWPNENENDLLK
jgi:hypothetical protein